MGSVDRGEVVINAHLCKGCCLCVVACPPAVLSQSHFLNRQGYYAVAYKGSGCTGCGICFYVCPEPAAITVHKSKSSNVATSNNPPARPVPAPV
jgi:2-oxoglutarate ferredoxin oxidoreductase subunit delta